MSSAQRESVIGAADLRGALLLCGMLGAMSCAESEVDSLGGQWSGEILCTSGRHDFSLSLEVFGESLSGEGASRSLNLDKIWRVRGGQEKEDREQPCSNDTCASNEACVAMGGSVCDPRSRCLNCVETVRVSIVELTLEDDDIQLVNPTMSLLRMGSDRMAGTIKSFCPADDRGEPSVTLSKQ